MTFVTPQNPKTSHARVRSNFARVLEWSCGVVVLRGSGEQWWPKTSCDGRVVTSAVRHFKICRQKKADLMVRHVPRSRAQETALHSTRCAARLGIHPQPHPTPRRAAVASGERALVLLSVGVLSCVFG